MYPDVLDYLERLAIISHNAGLARFEGYCRALSDSYDRYFKRMFHGNADQIKISHRQIIRPELSCLAQHLRAALRLQKKA